MAEAAWSYTEQMLHTLDEFETPDGFRIKHLETIPAGSPGALGCWRISLKGPKPNDPKSRFNIWLMMVSTGWVLTEVPSLRWTGGVPPFETPEEAITKGKELLQAREAAVRLGASP